MEEDTVLAERTPLFEREWPRSKSTEAPPPGASHAV